MMLELEPGALRRPGNKHPLIIPLESSQAEGSLGELRHEKAPEGDFAILVDVLDGQLQDKIMKHDGPVDLLVERPETKERISGMLPTAEAPWAGDTVQVEVHP